MEVLSDINVSGKRVFLRADLDVPLREAQVTNGERPDFAKASTGRLTTNARLQNLKPTINYLLQHGASQIIIAGHVDRPKGIDPALSTKNLLEPLKEILGQKIVFNDVILGIRQLTETPESDSGQALRLRSGPQGREFVEPARMTGESNVVLLENLRFWPGEVANDSNFAKKLASMADIYVNEAFGNSHRAHASMVFLPSLLPHAAGLHLQKEIEVLGALLKNPQRPFVAIVGGVKIETKIPVIENLCKIADFVLVGGLIAQEIQNSKFKIQNYKSKVKIAQVNEAGKDINNESISQFKSVIAKARTIVWNGPMGVFEEGFGTGTSAVAQAVIDSGAYSIVGGGETTEFLASKRLISKFSLVSSGGGAMLEFLSGKKLPALQALK